MMSRYQIPAPVRKKGRPERCAPFPVPLESFTGEPASVHNWYHYTGYLEGNRVIVKHSGDVDYLYKMGFFGKGNLSRNKPEYNHGGYWGFRRKRGQHEETVKVISRRKYLRHLAWKEESDTAGDFNVTESGSPHGEEFIRLPQSKKLKQANPHLTSQSEGSSQLIDQSETDLKKVIEQEPITGVDIKTEASDWSGEAYMNWGEELKEESYWPTAPEEVDPWSDAHAQESASFWGEAGPSITEAGTKLKPKESGDKQEQNIEKCDDKTETKVEKQTGSREIQSCPEADKATDKVTEADFSASMKRSDSSAPLHQPQSTSQIRHLSAPEGGCDATPEASTSEGGQHGAVDPRCLQEESQGNLLVVDDSEDSDCDWPDDRTTWLPVRKNDPIKIKEHLQLSLEEAFFLSYALGCLSVVDAVTGTPLDLTALWRRFCTAHKQFVPNYVAYHYLRSRGWVPKVGLKFGAEFVLYKRGPPFYHSTFSVTVRPLCDLDLKDDPMFSARPLTWRSLSGFNRVTEQVSKEVMLCYVIRPASLTEEDLQSPNCIKQFKVQEVVLKRWVSTKEREREEEHEIS